MINEERKEEILERLEAEWKNETLEQTMSIFNPSKEYLKLTRGNKSPDSMKKIKRLNSLFYCVKLLLFYYLTKEKSFILKKVLI